MKRIISTAILFAFLFTIQTATAFTQTTEFTYQGSLNNGAAPATGNYDFEFALFTAVAAGSQLGSTITVSNVAVTNGIFSAKIDFGSQFTGAARFLEIRVRQLGGGAFTTLTPRQFVNSAPYSVKSLTADTATTATNSTNATTATTATNATQLGGVAANQYVLTGDVRLTDARTPTAGSTNYVQNRTTQQTATNFNVSGTGTANILNAGTQFNLGGDHILSRPGGSNLFAGFNAGMNNTTGILNSFFGENAGINNTTGGANAFFGQNAGLGNTTGIVNSFFGLAAGMGNTTGESNSFFGWSAGISNTTGIANTVIGRSADVGSGNLTNATAIGARAVVNVSNSLVLGSINGINGAIANTNVGIGTTAPTERLHVIGNSLITGNLTVSGTLNATLPGNSTNYVQNRTTQQAATNFNVSGTGTADILNAGTQFNLGGERILSNPGNGNLFAGIGAGVNNTTGFENSFFGRLAGDSNTTGAFNSFFGRSAGSSNTTGISNSFFGSSAGSVNTTGEFNSFFGNFAGKSNITGFENSFFGQFAGLSNTTGGANSFFGNFAGHSNATGSNNTAIGRAANLGSNNLTNATAIGSSARVDASNSLVLGSIGGINSATADTSVGIGITAPTNPLSVVGSGTNAGGVGGFTEVVARFQQKSSARHSAISIDALTGQDPILYLAENGAAKWHLRNDSSDTDKFQIRSEPGGTRLTIDSAGNIGINTTTPSDRLDVNGVIRFSTLGTAGGTTLCRNASNQIASCSSSIRYKNNIKPFTPGLDLVLKLRPVSFNWKNGGMADLGLVAEEVAAIEPLMTIRNDEGEVEGVKYDRLNVAFVNAFKEQQLQIEAQQKQIDELRMIVCQISPSASVCQK